MPNDFDRSWFFMISESNTEDEHKILVDRYKKLRKMLYGAELDDRLIPRFHKKRRFSNPLY